MAIRLICAGSSDDFDFDGCEVDGDGVNIFDLRSARRCSNERRSYCMAMKRIVLR